MLELSRKNIVVYDLEIKNKFELPFGQYRDFTVEDFLEMGISVGTLYDYYDDCYKVFMDDNLDFLTERINDADLVVGFNIIKFDNPLLLHTSKNVKLREDVKCYDILEYSRRAVGWTPGAKYYPSGLKLDHHLEAMFGHEYKKIEDSAEAPMLYQTDQIGRLTTYSIDDVKKEKMVFEHICQFGTVKTLNHGEVEVYNPLEEILK